MTAPDDSVRILIVEDEQVVCDFIVSQLVRMGLAPDIIDSAPILSEARRLLSERRYRAIVCDLRLGPGASEAEVYAAVRALAQGAPIIVYTGGDIEAIRAALEGAAALVQKGGPRSWPEVEAVLHGLIGDVRRAADSAETQLGERRAKGDDV